MPHHFTVPFYRIVAGALLRKSGRFRPALENLEPRIALSGASQPGMEIAYIGNLGADFKGPTEVYLASGTNPITADAWANYVPPPNYLKNTSRNVEFDSVDFLTSPDSTTGQTYITTSDGYTWQFVTETVSANYPFKPGDYPGEQYTSAYQAAAFDPTPPEGVIRYSANTKNAITTWLARDSENQPIKRYFVQDAWKNLYIMQTSGVADDADVEGNFFAAVLPAGWLKFTGYLPGDLTTYPAYDNQGFAQYNIFRTSSDDAFQQVSWSPQGNGIAQHIADMPIWGGPKSDSINARRLYDSLIHAAQGNDTIRVFERSDTVYGDAGTDTVVFSGHRRRYVLTVPRGDRSTVVVTRLASKHKPQVVTLHDVERIRFADGMVFTAALKKPPGFSPSRSPLWRTGRIRMSPQFWRHK